MSCLKISTAHPDRSRQKLWILWENSMCQPLSLLLYFTGYLRLTLIWCRGRLHKDKNTRRQRPLGRSPGRLDAMSSVYSTGQAYDKTQIWYPCTRSLWWTWIHEKRTRVVWVKWRIDWRQKVSVLGVQKAVMWSTCAPEGTEPVNLLLQVVSDADENGCWLQNGSKASGLLWDQLQL